MERFEIPHMNITLNGQSTSFQFRGRNVSVTQSVFFSADVGLFGYFSYSIEVDNHLHTPVVADYLGEYEKGLYDDIVFDYFYEGMPLPGDFYTLVEAMLERLFDERGLDATEAP